MSGSIYAEILHHYYKYEILQILKNVCKNHRSPFLLIQSKQKFENVHACFVWETEEARQFRSIFIC